ncbi:iron dicitrate transporter FecR [Allostella sp. ATCC 35155]|nr:iron dicitrate transporter FecR [Stella sp. ATCC 35155]
MADDPAERIPDAMLEVAVIWLMRRREPGRDCGDEAAFRGWLQADPRHVAAVAMAKRLWDAAALPAATAAAADVVRNPPGAARPGRPVSPSAGRLRPWALAAAVLLLVAAGAVWGPRLRDDLRADYRTATGEHRTVELADGSRIALNTGTALAFDRDAAGRRARLFRGEAFFAVTREPARPFRVETPAGSVEVLGTRFNVRLADHRTIVTVVEGRVAALSRAGGMPQPVGAGQQSVITAAAASVAAEADPDVATAWRRGQLVFYRAKLSNVADELGRYLGGRILLLTGGLGDRRITGAFDTGRPDAALDAIAAMLGITVHRLPFGLRLLR